MSSINPNSKSLLKSKTKRKNQNKAEESNKKQKSAKKSFYSDNDSDSLKEEQEQDEDISKWAKQDNSLSQLTQSFLDYIKKKGRIRISINELVEDLNVKKRRIYDITNVLEGKKI
jgi:transcription factor E2F3